MLKSKSAAAAAQQDRSVRRQIMNVLTDAASIGCGRQGIYPIWATGEEIISPSDQADH
jgi:hypothetical protein